MLPKKSRHVFYALLVIAVSIAYTTVVANTKVINFIAEVASAIETNSSSSETEGNSSLSDNTFILSKTSNEERTLASAFMTTIIQGADQEVNCPNDGSTVARFSLCGDFDDRAITVSASGTLEWEQVTGGCTPDISVPCPDGSCTYTNVGSSSTFMLDASAIPSTGAEFRVRVNGSGTWYYFEVSKSTITQTHVKTDFICGKSGRIQITGLSAAFEFSIDNGSGFGPWQGPSFENLTPGTYNVKARQKSLPGGCEYIYEPIEIRQRDIDFDVTFVDAKCSGDTGSVSVDVNASVPGPYKYTLLDDAGTPQEFTAFLPADNYTFSAVGFGTYTVQVETPECAGDLAAGIDPPRESRDVSGNPIVIGNSLVALTASTEVNSSFGCSTITSVDIKLEVSGGSAPYTYTVNSGPVQPAFTGSTTFTVTAGGSYDFLVTDNNGCTIPASSNVEDLAPPSVLASGVNGTCSNGGAKINFDVIRANGYNLSFRVDKTEPWDINTIISVPAGTYNDIEVLYEQGSFSCTLTLPTVTVTNVGVITGSATKISDRTCDVAGGTIGGQIDFGAASGGSGSGYVFSIDGVNFTTTTSYTGLVPGKYTPMIQDGGGCRLELTPITILDVDPPKDITFAQNSINCGAGTSDVILTVTGPAAIATYEILSPVAVNNAGNATFVGLSIGTLYEFKATDVNGCSVVKSFTPVVRSTIRARVKSGGDLRVCTGESDGTGTFLVDGFGGNYTYNINGGTESAPQNDLEVALPASGAGTYTITVTDEDTGCTDSASLDIEEPAATIDVTGKVQAMSCANGNRGLVTAKATGGWGGYLYTLSYPAASGVADVTKTGRTFTNLTDAGDYVLSVVDSEGCTDTFNFTLTPLTPPTIALDPAASDFCYVAGVVGATIGVSSSMGTAPHQYRINSGGLQASPVFTGLTPGNYTVEVVDANNCKDELNVTIRPQLRVNTSVDTEIPCGGGDGQIRVRVTGGYLTSPDSPATPKSYEVSFNGGAFSAATSFSANSFLYSVSTGGTYVFRVTDNENCVAVSSPLVIEPPTNILPATVDVKPVSCGAPNNGRVTITPDATSGIPPYEVNFNGSGWSTQTVYSNLTVGTYPFLVRDSRGCVTPAANAVVTLDTTAAPNATVSQITATCTAAVVSGGISITNIVNGTPNFTVSIQDGFGNTLFTFNDVNPATDLPLNVTNPVLIPGTYSVVTLDANGCRDQDFVTIVQTTVNVVPLPVTPICTATGFSQTVNIVGGVGPFLIRLATDPNPPVPPSNSPRQHTFTGLLLGVTYLVQVTDTATGCVYITTLPPVVGGSPLAVTATSTPGFCDINRRGQIVYTITGYALGNTLRVGLRNNVDGTVTPVETVTPTTATYSNNLLTLPGNYQIVVANLTTTCNAGTPIIVLQNLPSITVLAEEPANCNAEGQIVVQGTGGAGGPYQFAYMATGSTPAASDWTPNTTFIGPAATYDVYVRDASNCTSFAIATIIRLEPSLTPPTLNVVNQCDVTATDFEIQVTMPGTTSTPRFTLAGDTQFGVFNAGTNLWEYTYRVSSPGDYTVDVIDAKGCTSKGIADVYEFLTAFGDFSVEPTCNDADGTIMMTVIGGSNQFSYQLQDAGGANIGTPVVGDRTAGILTGVAPGDYQVEVIDTETLCDFTVKVELDLATLPVIDDESKKDITCAGDDDGSIDITLRAGTDIDGPVRFILMNLDTSTEHDRNRIGSFDNLPPAKYQVEVLTGRKCSVLSTPIDIIEPTPFVLTASAPTSFVCEPRAGLRSTATITVTGSNGTPGLTPGQEYQYSIIGFRNYQYANTFEITDNGTTQNITIYAIDANGCQATTNVVLNPPMDVTSSLAVVSALDCANPEQVRITVTGTTDFTVSTAASVTVAPVTNTPGNDFVDIFLPSSGDFSFEIQDNTPSGCAYPLPLHKVIEPIEPVVTIDEAEPIGCFGASDGAITIEVTDYTGSYSYSVYEGSDVAKTTVIASGNLDTATNPETITGLSGGNFFVEVTATAMPFCSAESNITTIRTPSAALSVTAVERGNVSCNNNTGRIEATGLGGWDTSPYEYRLLKSTDNGVTYTNEIAAFSNKDKFRRLSFGFYRVEIRDLEMCTATFDIELDEVVQIDAGIRESTALLCPSGNSAVLEAYDPTSGDDTSAAAGASGGFAGAGYTYRLLYLNSDDNTDVASSSGLQNTPTFIGATGGFISAGWYAIEVASSFGCTFVTTPYLVSPPPEIEPRLAQTRVPGCGGDGQIRLFINNHDAASGFEYEYRRIPTVDPLTDPWIDMGAGVSELILNAPGSPAGISYQYEVRKKNASSTCLPVNSNGITLTDALAMKILPSSPMDDISCASELDGRIESFIEGGVGDEMFTIYTSDPGDGFNSAGAAVYSGRPSQRLGTFEGLEAGNYWIGAVSGRTCEDSAGPFEIIRPEPILFTTTAIPTTCNGAEDGKITIEVTSGGVGLIQFAMAPNFSEFFNDATTPGVYTFDDLESGTYDVLIQDENGCFERITVDVSEPEAVASSVANVTPETCIGFADGTATLSVVGGTPFVDATTSETYYETRLVGPDSDGTEVFVRNDDLYFDDLVGGKSYIVFIRDANDCSIDIVIPIEIGVDLTASANIVYGCEGIFPESTSSITMEDSSLTADLLFALDPVDPTDAISANASNTTTWGNLTAGDHIVYIYHENGCTNSVTFKTEAYEPLTLTAQKTGPNEVTALAEGGYGNYEYFFQGESAGTETVYNTEESTVVNIRVEDERGCVASIAIPFEFTGMIDIPNFFTPDGDENNDFWAPNNREFFPNIEVKIYDRYGRVVSILDEVKKWDGKYDGTELPSGDYWYVINANDRSQLRYVGHFTLYR